MADNFLKPDWGKLWATCQLDNTDFVNKTLAKYLALILKHIAEYKYVEKMTGVPWFVVACIHMKEASFDFNACLHNGQPWNKKTTIVPKGLGPWGSWQEAAVHAMIHDKLHLEKDWSPANIFERLERYNGIGYRKRGVYSPYVTAYTNHSNEKGRYVADGKYDANSVAKNLGCMALIKHLANENLISFGDSTPVIQPPKEVNTMTKLFSIPKLGDHGADVATLQTALKKAGYYPHTVDGLFGPKTTTCVSKYQKSRGLDGSGKLGPKTIAFLGLEVVAVSPVTGLVAITKNFIGKKEKRNLHPTFRLLLEAKVFKNGLIPRCFIERDLVECVRLITQALVEMGIREDGANLGEVVGYVQGVVGSYKKGGNGDHWCMSAVQCVIALLEDYYQIESPVSDSEHCVTVMNAAKLIPGLVAPTKIAEGGILIGQYKPKTSGHTGYVVKKISETVCVTREGNTGDKSVNDGDGYYERTRDVTKTAPLVVLGTVYIWPNNIIPQAQAA